MGRDIIILDDLTINNLGTFKKLILVTLPTLYPESWYKDSLNSDQIVKIAFYSELPVGEIKGKLINSSHNIPTFLVATSVQVNSKIIPNAVYLESVSVLEAYRGLGIGSKLLNFAIEEAKLRFVHEIVLHAHVDNTSAIEWYKQKGFIQIGDTVVNYYKEQGFEDPDAIMLSLKF